MAISRVSLVKQSLLDIVYTFAERNYQAEACECFTSVQYVFFYLITLLQQD